MQLSIIYRGGETRVLNLHPTFFVESQEGLAKLKLPPRDAKISLAQRCMDLATSLSGYPFKVACVKNGIDVFNRTWLENKPATAVDERVLTNKEKEAVKSEMRDLRREFKNQKFTQKWDFTTGLFTNLLTGEKMYSVKNAA